MSGPGRIGIVDHMSAGGVSRFLLALISHIAALHPQTTFTYFVSRTNIERDALVAGFAAYPNVTLVALEPPALNPTADRSRGVVGLAMSALGGMPALYAAARGVWRFLRSSVLPASMDWWRYSLSTEVVERFAELDVVYFGWPFYCEPVTTPVPLVATFHDLHFKHFPGSYVGSQLELLERQTRGWLERCTTAIASTNFIRDEITGYYGDVAPAVEVVYLAPYGFERPDAQDISEALGRLGVRRPYALFSGGRSSHKNIAAVIEAVGILKQQGTPVNLVITGLGSQDIGSRTDAPPGDPLHEMNRLVAEYGLVRGEDLFALGYVGNADVDALTSGADVVVSASLYEAGCGPAMDAWQAGVPVAFSNIPPFVEQIERFGVRAWVFDPHDPADVADKIHSAVFDEEQTRAMVDASLAAFTSYTWDDVAREYYRVFSEAAERGARDRVIS